MIIGINKDFSTDLRNEGCGVLTLTYELKS